MYFLTRASARATLVALLLSCSSPNDDYTYHGYESTYTSTTPYKSTPYVMPDFDWTPAPPPKHQDCEGWDCREQGVLVTYALSEQALDEAVTIEAFDNPEFLGAPETSTLITSFDGSRPGAHGKGSLWLHAGRHYLRAFLESAEFTVSSSAVQVDLERAPVDDAVIVLNRVRRDEASPFGTGAHLRFLISYAPCRDRGCPELPPGTEILLRLVETEDLDETPAFQFALSVDALRIATRPGLGELVSTELPLNAYAAYAFVDLLPNGYLDEGEPRAILGAWDAPAFIKTKSDATPTLTLELAGPTD